MAAGELQATNMIRAIIFDWSGVVKDAIKSHLWVVNRMFKHFGAKEISLDELKENWKQPYMLFYEKYLPKVTEKEQDIVYKEAILSPECPKAESFPGILKLIKKLKERGLYLTVITSDLPDTVFQEIKDYGLDGVFDNVVVNVNDKSKAVEDLILKKKFNPEEAVIIGDSNHEIEIAREIGIKSVAVSWGFFTEERLKAENPDFMVHNLQELEEIIL